MKTTIHTYSFDTNNPEDAAAYAKLSAELKATKGRGHWMHCIGAHNVEAGEIELEAKHLFENQWNADKGRVFDWFEECVYSYGKERTNIKRGHYLDFTDEMRAVRSKTVKCGYTGQQFPSDTKPAFNLTAQGLGSPYLKETELHLLRLLPCDTPFSVSRAPLQPYEKAMIMPLYLKAQKVTAQKLKRDQLTAARKNARGLIVEAKAKAKKLIEAAKAQQAGLLWLIDRGLTTENAIFYSHTGRWGFGWRSPYTGEARTELLKSLAKFPFDYDVV